MDDHYNNFTRDFVGVVEEVIDEAFVRVRCFGVHPLDRSLVRTDQLPKALVVYPTTGGQVTSGSISHNLQVDSWVIGKFIDAPLCQQPIVTGVIQGTDYSMSTYPTQGGEFVEQGGNPGRAGPGGPGSTPQPDTPVDTTATTNIPGDSNIQKTYNYVYAKLIAENSSSDPHLHTSALVGVLMLETPGINPTVSNRIGAYGICQWLGARREQLFQRYGRTQRLDQQLDFMWWELNHSPERRYKALWLQGQNMPDAVAGFAAFERAEEWQRIGDRWQINRQHYNFRKRLEYAYQCYNSTSFTG